MKNSILATLFLVIFCWSSLRAQEEYSPSLPANFGIPTIQSSENLSSGSLNIGLPIGNHIIPIGINFNTGGIKVKDRPNELGMGWKLNCGGYISRERRGLADENTEGYSGSNQRGQNVASSSIANWSSGVFANYSNEEWDSEPDVFRFNFMGYTGAFVISPSRMVVKLTPNNLKIVPSYNSADEGSFDSFTIYDENGNIYFFEDKSSLVVKEGSETVSNTDTRWNLNYKEDYKTGERINFYNSSPTFSREERYRYAYLRDDYTVKQVVWGDYDIYINNSSVNRVTFRNKEIKFKYTLRGRSSEYLLDSIILRIDGNDHLKYVFNYTYINERPFLTSVVKQNSMGTQKIVIYQFEYYGQSSNEESLPAYAIYPNVNQDHWGYYNDNPYNSLIKYGLGRTPYLNRALAGNLKKVYHPGGGFEEYKYQLNTYTTSSGYSYAAGGLRIKEIHKNDGQNNYQVRTYNYIGDDGKSSGQLYASPEYLEPFSLRCYGNMEDVAYLTKEFSSRNLYDIQERHIVYKKVTVTNIDGGKEVYYFNGYSDEESFYNDGGYHKLPNKYDYRYAEDGGLFDCSKNEYSKTPLGQGDGWPYVYNYYGSYAGTLSKKIIMNHENKKQVEELYEYTRNPVNSIVFGAAFSMYEDYLGTGKKDNFRISLYQFRPVYIMQNKLTRYVYDEENQNNKTTHFTDIFYNNTYNLPIKTEAYLSGDYANRNVIESTYLVEEPEGVSNVTNHNIIGALKRVTRKKGVVTLTENINVYGNTSSGKVELQETQNKIKGNLVSHKSIVYDIGSKLPVGSTNEITNKAETIIYDNNNNHKLATINNSEQNQVAYTGFEVTDLSEGNWTIASGTRNSSQKFLGESSYDLSSGNISKTSLPGGKYHISYWKYSGTINFAGVSSNTLTQTKTFSNWTLEEREIVTTGSTLTLSGTGIIDELKLKPIDAVMETYSYHKLFGKTSETDENHNTIYYEYDDFGRMDVVRDDERNIIKTSSYNISKFMNISQSSIGFSYQGGNAIFRITSNVNWTVATTDSWITLNKTEGELSDVITVSCSSNTGSGRSGTITISGEGDVPDKTISVSQEDGSISHLTITNSSGYDLDDMYIDATVNPPPNTVTVTSNVNWSVSVSDVNGPSGWPEQIYPTSGNGNGQFTISHSTPSPGGYYSALIKVTGGGITRQFTLYVH